MARITVEDCLKKVNNRFLLVNMVAKRVRQIREGSEYLVNSPKNEDIVVALREVAAGKVKTRDPRIEELAPVAALDAAPTAEAVPPEPPETEAEAPAPEDAEQT